ncbi:MAG: pantetheine-phosphate adenylyltransferase [Lachnospiraceae bacterium]|nr:pantetheine-phosphate adenylyltransferase [Lachnospiraceae bacterium]
MTRAIYAGSFDPVTNGHLDIIDRASRIFDELIIGVLINKNKSPMFDTDERVGFLRVLLKDYHNVKVKAFDGLLVDFAHNEDAKVLVRGLRAVTDFEYELQMAQTNKVIASDVETVFLTTNLKYSYLSSSIVKEIASFNGDISQFVDPYVEKEIFDKLNTRKGR